MVLKCLIFRNEGVDFWGLTAQNEPMDGNIEDFSFNCMGWNATTQVRYLSVLLL
jgi:glucosylceramidase